MKFDPTISLGSIITMLGVMVTILSMGVSALRHMTRQEEIIKGMLVRLEKLEKAQEKQGDAMARLSQTLSEWSTKLDIVYSWMMGKGKKGEA